VRRRFEVFHARTRWFLRVKKWLLVSLWRVVVCSECPQRFGCSDRPLPTRPATAIEQQRHGCVRNRHYARHEVRHIVPGIAPNNFEHDHEYVRKRDPLRSCHQGIHAKLQRLSHRADHLARIRAAESPAGRARRADRREREAHLQACDEARRGSQRKLNGGGVFFVHTCAPAPLIT
jgi:hypothetical protein